MVIIFPVSVYLGMKFTKKEMDWLLFNGKDTEILAKTTAMTVKQQENRIFQLESNIKSMIIVSMVLTVFALFIGLIVKLAEKNTLVLTIYIFVLLGFIILLSFIARSYRAELYQLEILKELRRKREKITTRRMCNVKHFS